MKHRKGIDLLEGIPPATFYEYESNGSVYRSLADIQEAEIIGAKCGKCGRMTWLDTASVRRRVGNQYLVNLPGRMVCQCGNRSGNRLLIGRMARH